MKNVLLAVSLVAMALPFEGAYAQHVVKTGSHTVVGRGRHVKLTPTNHPIRIGHATPRVKFTPTNKKPKSK